MKYHIRNIVRMFFTLLLGGASPALAQIADTDDLTLVEQMSGEVAGTLNVIVNNQPFSIDYIEGDNDLAIYQGDIVIGDVSALRRSNPGVSLQDLEPEVLFGLAYRGRDTRWPRGEVRYMVNADLANVERIYSAIAEWESKTPIRFIEIEHPIGDFVEFVTGNGCYSSIGMTGNRQIIGLSTRCRTGNVIHEIGHALGLHHEQARNDRNSNIAIFTDNIRESGRKNFNQDPTNFKDVGNYCYGSISHYGNYAFSKERGVLKTIETIPPGIPIGQRKELSQCDVDTIKNIYGFAYDDNLDEFSGELLLVPEGCENQGKCYLKHDISYVDQSNVVWKVGKWIEGQEETIQTGTTDGATIPSWAQSFIGEPFDEEYLLAAVLHDHYCYKENHVRTWRQTHRMFYNALISLGVPSVKAKTMYAAVYLGGPKWQHLVPGENCGPNCIYDALQGSENYVTHEENQVYFRDNSYESKGFMDALSLLNDVIVGDEDVSLYEIEDLIHELNPDDHFYFSPDVFQVSSSDDLTFE